MDFKEKVLIISDDRSLYMSLREDESKSSFHVFYCGKQDNVFGHIKNNHVKTVILDTGGDETWDFSLLKLIKTFDPIIEVIVAGLPIPSDKLMDWINSGATDYLCKPFEISAMQAIFKRIWDKRSLRRETYLLEKELEKKYFFHGMVGKSPFMLEVFSQIETLAKYFSTVLISGDTGTGKELAAKAIHDLSPLKDKKFVLCDCVSTPDSLFESELFGYVKGAFTGADRNKKGLFEEADGGVIFLDEIGELPLAVQAKLLRVLETRQFRPLGSTVGRSVDVRVIAASNRNLREEIRKGAFREDLFHRLSRIEIHLPPLTSRAEDIPLLIRFFLEKYAKKFGKRIKGVSRQAQKLLMTYHWPGNVRELKNVLESSMIMCQKEFIDIVDLPKNLQKHLAAESESPFFRSDQIRTLQNLESEYISYLMKANDYNIRKTAKILDISRSTLYEKLKKYQISVQRQSP